MSVAESASNPLTPLYAMVGLAVLTQLAQAIISIVKGLAARTVEREDKDKDELKKKIEDHEVECKKQRDTLENDLDEIRDGNNDLSTRIIRMDENLKATLEALQGMRGSVGEIREGVDKRFEKQAEFYRSELEKHRQDTSQAITRAMFDARRLDEESYPPPRARRKSKRRS